MMNWQLPPDLQKKYQEVVNETRELQKYFGITPMTIEERVENYKKEEEIKLSATTRRPLPKWKL